ncbi:MAG: hypothetical protein NZ602_00885 [Thermoguttaceae bacterium]|nr:hypothetical protein [Thermoguttaceae bacterium]MDW8038039.1 hypothetical protein [Thermoguttaceae bacterium]
MRKWAWMLAMGAIWALGGGCGQSGSSGTGEQGVDKSSDSPPTIVQQNPNPKLEPPAEAVYEFLEAVRKGDDQGAERMLTSLARKKTQEMNMVVAPPGSDTASFQVGKVTMLDDNRAEVLCKWTDREPDGSFRTDEIIWLVKKEPEGWRVAGMAAMVFPDQPPYPLNFEDPEDMLRQQEKIKTELARREAASRASSQSHTAQPPAGGSQESTPHSGLPEPPPQTAQTPDQPIRR